MKKEKIKILHIVTSFEDGGLERIVSLLVNNIKNDQIQHFVVSLIKSKTEFLLEDLKKSEAELVGFEFHNKITGVGSLLINLKGIFELASYIKKNKINIVHSYDFFPAFMARLSVFCCLMFFGYRVDKVFISLQTMLYWLKPVHNFINRILSIYTNKIICVSYAVKDFSSKKDKIKLEKYQVIYNAVDTDLYTPDSKLNDEYKSQFSIQKDDIVMANVGVLSVRKGQKFLIEAFTRLVKENQNLKLLIFGSEREHEKNIAEEIYALIRQYNLENNVKIIKPRKDLNFIYNIFDVYIMPSVTEGLSLSAMEAMLMERICLFSDIPPFKEMVEEGSNGFLFKSENVDALYSKLEFILKNLGSLKTVGEKARRIALEKYDMKRMCKEYEKLYLN